jgi:hypothetical protein
MRQIGYMATALALVWFAPFWSAAQVPDGRSELAANAALQYWQAFSQLPVIDESQEKVLSELLTTPVNDPAVTKLLDGSRQSLMYLHRGAALKQCDWGLDYDDGISMLMPHLAKSRDVARLAVLDARRAFENKNWKAGRHDLTSVMVLARHTNRDPVMIGLLVRLLLEGLVVDTVAPYVPELKVPHADAAMMFEQLPPAVTLEQSIRFEKKWMSGSIAPHLRSEEARQPGGGLALWKQFVGQDAPEELKTVASLDEVIRMVETVFPIYDELARLAALPYDQFAAQHPAFKQRVKAQQPVAALLLPSIDELKSKEDRQQARMAMLLAGIAYVEGGQAKLDSIKDPFGSGPFELRKLDEGFELKSKLQAKGQPVTLVIGKRK